MSKSGASGSAFMLMVKTVPRYNPPVEFADTDSVSIAFDLRVMTREGEVLIDFGEFSDLLSYNDNLNVESPSGNWNIKMRATLDNIELLKRIHPGLVVEIYACCNDDPLKDVEAFIPQDPNPPVFTSSDTAGVTETAATETPTDTAAANAEAQGAAPESTTTEAAVTPSADTGALLSPEFAPVDGKAAAPPEPDEADYLDKAPYLLMRGVTNNYGRTSSIIEGSGAETSLTLSGKSYGSIYQDCSVLVDRTAPTSLGKALEVRYDTQTVQTVVPLYYGVLRHWVEEFWGEPTGWEARTRPIPVPPDIMARLGGEGSVWNSLQYLSVQGIFHIFTDHTGAICWEKLPYSSRCDTLIDQFMKEKVGVENLRNWEDLPLIKLPSWMIQSWSDRLSSEGVFNYLRCQMTQYGGSGGGQSNMDAGQIYNQGSIRQYGGPKKMEIMLPAGTAPTFPYEDTERQEREDRLRTFMDLVVLECARWYDRPVQRCMLNVRGDSVWRINTRIEIKEDWHNPDAIPGQYYVVGRSHSIDVGRGNWTTQLECVRDRRTRYLGIGNQEKPEVKKKDLGTPEDELEFELPPDEFWFFDRNSDKGIIKIEDFEAFIEPYYPPDRDQCLAELEQGEDEQQTDTAEKNKEAQSKK